jgi:hypothetical protein
MSRVSVDVSPTNRSISFPNGTTLESISAYGSATQFTPAARGLRSAELPSEIDTSPLFERALAEAGFFEQETIHLEALPESALRSGTAEDTLVLRPSIPPGDTDRRVVLYEDESGGMSWHFAEGSRLTQEEKDLLESRGMLRDSETPTFIIPGRTTAAREGLTSGPPQGALRGFITKIGRKVLKVLVIPVAAKLLDKPVELLAGAIEARIRQNRVWQLTPDNYTKGPECDFSDWKSLDGKPTLLVVHGIFSSVEGMLSKLPRDAMERWSNHYQGRTIGFNHLSVALSPEENARFFLETAKRAVPDGKFQFDVLCHSRGGVVSRTLAERGRTVFSDTNSAFRKIYFAASPNKGSALGDPEHMLEMIDVFTNLLTQFPDGHVLYAIETILGVVKLLAYTAGVALPGMASMSTTSDGYIAKVLNQASEKSPAKYAATGSDYVPRTGVSNGFFTGQFATDIMDRIFVENGHPVANDLVVPKDGVFAGNGHPSFPILNPLVYKGDDAVWHGGFFSEPRTIRHIEKFLEIENEDSAPLDQVVAGTRGSGRPLPVSRLGVTDAPRDVLDAAKQPYSGIERDLGRPALRSGDITGAGVVLPASESASRAAVVEREPLIEFHEVVEAGVPNELTVLLSEVVELDEVENRFAIEFAAGEYQIELTVELIAPGFTIVGERTAKMVIKRARDPETEKAKFNLVAKDPGAKPVTRMIVASFFRGGDCLGGATHTTEVIPAGYSGEYTARGEGHSNRVVISSRQRADADLIVYVLEDTAHPDTFEIAIRSNVPGEEYQMRDKGTLKLEGSDFSNFFSKVIDPQFQSFPRGTLNEAEFDAALATWSQKFLTTLDDLGRNLWTLLPEEFRNEYLRLLALPNPPRSLCIYSDEMVLPWELVRPSGIVNGKFEEYPRLGVQHILARWTPALGARPQPQSLRIDKMTILTPEYKGKPLFWAQKESEELLKLIQGVDRPATVDRQLMEALLNGCEVQLVHFNGHGTWDATGDLTALELSNNDSIPALAFDGRKLGMTAHPILYLNACTVGRTALNVGRPGGFAASCLRNGWSGVIAPYWSVYDPQAMAFCVKLYRKLKTGICIGEALQQIRCDEPANFTAQSYAYFGDPYARLLFQ